MKKNQNSLCVMLAVLAIGCGVKGVEDRTDSTDTLPAADTGTTAITEIKKDIDSLQIDFDTAYNFAQKKPVDSLKLPSGVKLKFIQKGTGDAIKKYDVVAIHYRGTLTNGKVIESNEVFKKAVPFVVGIKMTFDAFDEVLQKCHVGDKIKFIIPAEKAYGKKGRGNVIPPNSDLVYEMDVVEKVKGKKTASGVEYFSLYSKGVMTQPAEGDKVSVAYMGWVKKTGKLFDASAGTGKLYEFELGTGKAIKAWHEVVAQMHEGEKMLLLAPAATCYGSRGVPELVAPNSDLIYILELKEIGKKSN